MRSAVFAQALNSKRFPGIAIAQMNPVTRAKQVARAGPQLLGLAQFLECRVDLTGIG